MARGKQTCKILKEIRRQIAEANDIEFVTSECRYQGDCPGTCPKCESEVRYLEEQLRARSLSGRAVALAGISVGALAMMTPSGSSALPINTDDVVYMGEPSISVSMDTVMVKGRVVTIERDENGKLQVVPLQGVLVEGSLRASARATDANGCFKVKSFIGDSLKVQYVGYQHEIVPVTASDQPIEVVMVESDLNVSAGIVPVLLSDIVQNVVELKAVNEKEKTVNPAQLRIERVVTDENGREETVTVPLGIEVDKTCVIVHWNEVFLHDNGDSLEKVTLRISADGYEPVTLELDYPKTKVTKTVVLMRSRK